MQFERETIELFKHMLQKEGVIKLPSEGNSMFPLINNGNLCTFIYCEPEQLIKGDVVLYYTSSGELIAHRFFEVKTINYMTYYIFKGDTNLSFDAPVKEHQIIGKLATIQKVKRTVNTGDLPAGLWAKIILTLPALSGILQKYLNWKQHYQF